MKKAFVTVTILGTLFITTACAPKHPTTQAQKEPTNTKNEMSATYLGEVDSLHVKLDMNGTKKLAEINPTLQSVFDTIQQNDYITFEYETDRSNAMTITALKEWRKSIGAETEPTDSSTTEEDQPEKEETKATLTIPVLDGYATTSKGETKSRVYKSSNPAYYAEIEQLEDGTDIQRQRWNAASMLKPVGPLKEITQSLRIGNNQNVQFIFEAKNNQKTERVAVVEKDGVLVKYVVVIPKGENSEEIEQNFWDMLDRVTLVQ